MSWKVLTACAVARMGKLARRPVRIGPWQKATASRPETAIGQGRCQKGCGSGHLHPACVAGRSVRPGPERQGAVRQKRARNAALQMESLRRVPGRQRLAARRQGLPETGIGQLGKARIEAGACG